MMTGIISVDRTGNPRVLTRINFARALLLLGFLLGANSLYYLMKMVGDPNFLLVPSSGYPPTHGWYIAFREYVGGLAMTAAIGLAFCAKERHRTRIAWWMCAVLMLGFYGAFWIGRPFMPALTTPNAYAEVTHIVMAVPAVTGLLIAWPEFRR